MIDLFDKLYSIKFSFFFKILYLDKLYRNIIKISSNIFLPIYFYLTPTPKLSKKYNETNTVVSITTFPMRINRLWLVLECLLRQKVRPNKILIWLSECEFKDYKSLPKNLLKLKKNGIEIFIVKGENLKSHKKYYYALTNNTNDLLITLDDDVLYNSRVVSSLMEEYEKNINCIICNAAYNIGYSENHLLCYKDWESVNYNYKSKNLFPVGIGGVLYPPKSLNNLVLNESLFMSLCPNADDIWLKAMSLLNNTSVVRTSYHSYFLPIMYINNKKLNRSNVNDFKNDEQLSKVINYFQSKINKNLFLTND